VEAIRNLVVRATTAATRADRLEAYGQLVRQFRDMACGYAYAILGDFHLAEDAAQEAFVVAFERLGQLDRPEAFPGWFRRIVWSCCGRLVRRRQVPTVTLEMAAGVASPAAEPAAAAERSEMRRQVAESIRELPADQREATTLFYINGYSQADIADFLEVPLGTVKNRLSASRDRLKERMLTMVRDTLHQGAPSQRFDETVIEELLSQPRPLEMTDHPSRLVWDAIRSALAEYEVIDPGSEIEDEPTARQAEDHAWEDHAYRPSDRKALRFQMTTVTMAALGGRRPPVRILAAGRVFRPDSEDPLRAKVFHQMDGVCIEPGAGEETFKATCERALQAAVPGSVVRWVEHNTDLVSPGFEAVISKDGQEANVLGGGMFLAKTLAGKGFDPERVAGFAWGLGLDRLAMLRFGISDIRMLWQPPYLK
jgi:RNA polymerase sigma factor (sigma-70 family)